ncbi:MAG TPA: NAD(P)-dependent oxidoreductase [Gemmatirosa sp.]|nr:NAD(P)-dependent oxidoreductase [Gemmatirosa sp.]
MKTPSPARRALVIGAAGNIGRRLTAHLRQIGYDVLEADHRPGWRDGYVMADITHPIDLLPAFDWHPDVVFLCAATVGRAASDQASSMAMSTNLVGVLNVLQLCRRVDATCVFFSSSEVYGPGCDPMDDARSVPCPNNRYGLSKYLGEQLVEFEVRNSGLRAVTLRPCMIYDEHEDVGEHRSAMIRFASNLAQGRPITVHAGSARGWLHAEDAVRAIEAAGRLGEYAVMNIGHPEVRAMADLAAMMCEELDADPSLVRVAELPPQMTLVKRPTLERQRELLGIEPAVSLREGVRRVCAVQRQAAQRAQETGRRLPLPPLVADLADVGGGARAGEGAPSLAEWVAGERGRGVAHGHLAPLLHRAPQRPLSAPAGD